MHFYLLLHALNFLHILYRLIKLPSYRWVKGRLTDYAIFFIFLSLPNILLGTLS